MMEGKEGRNVHTVMVWNGRAVKTKVVAERPQQEGDVFKKSKMNNPQNNTMLVLFRANPLIEGT